MAEFSVPRILIFSFTEILKGLEEVGAVCLGESKGREELELAN